MPRLILAVCMTGVLNAQSGAPPVAGSWSAQFQGHTFIRLELQSSSGAVTGGMSLGDIEVDRQGAPRRVGEAPRDLTPIFDVSARDAVLTFARRDGTDIDRFELRLTGEGRAELRFLLGDDVRRELAGSGIPEPKPIPLVRQQLH